MDNSLTTWIIVALLVLLIGAAIFMLLRRPGGADDSLDRADAPVVDRAGTSDPTRPDELDGRTAPEEAQAVAAPDRPARDDAPFDQSIEDTGGATPVRPDESVASEESLAPEDSLTPEERRIADEYRAPDPHLAPDAHPADDFLGVDAADPDAAVTDPTYQDPRAEGHVLAEDPVDQDLAADRDMADRDTVDRDEVGYTAPPATEGYEARPADQQAYEAHPAGQQAYEEHPAAQGEDLGHERPAHGSHDGEPLTADEVLDARGVADSDTGEGYAAPPPPVEPDHTDAAPDRADVDDQDHLDHGDRGADRVSDLDRDTSGAFSSGAAAPEAASAASAPAHVDEPVVDDTGDEPAAGGAVFAESVYGPGSVEPAEDGSGPAGWEIKGNTGSMLFHTADSPSYDAVRADVWFDSEESARESGFAHWDRRRR